MRNFRIAVVFMTITLAGASIAGCIDNRTPDCNGASQQLVDLCEYDEVEAQLYYEGCTAYTLGDNDEMRIENADETECILASTSCDEAMDCQ